VSAPKNDYVSGVDQRDKRMKDKLMSQFVNHDSTSRPATQEYLENWERIFGKGQ